MRLYLVDSSIFVFKAWFAQKLVLHNTAGQANHAFIGFSDFVYQLLTEISPSNLVFAFDESPAQSQRKTIYPEYKANRSPTPDTLKRQFAWCQQWVLNLGISRVSSREWEADDLIGTLATMHRSTELKITILSADKDLTQLIREGDLWWPFYDSRKMDYRAISKKYGVRPEQIADQLALTGDKVDNIPGIPFIGPKTAANLLRKFGDLKNLRENLDQVSKMKFRYAARVQESLIENQAILDISSQLTAINCQLEGLDGVPIDRCPPQIKQLYDMMDEQAMDPKRRQKWESYLNRV